MNQPGGLRESPQARDHMLIAFGVLVVAMVLAAVGAVILVVQIRPDKDNSALIASILGVIVPTTGALLALIRSTEVARVAKDTHVLVNDRLTQLLAATKAAAHAEGRLAGKSEASNVGA